jgi:hypothetical protein
LGVFGAGINVTVLVTIVVAILLFQVGQDVFQRLKRSDPELGEHITSEMEPQV